MFKKIFMVLVVGEILFGFIGSSFAMWGMCDMGPKKANAAQSTAEKVGNKFCPVTGEAVDMKNPVTYEYKGKVYNLCCKACVKDFKKDPKKYIEKLEATEAKEDTKHQDHAGHSGNHEGPHHQ